MRSDGQEFLHAELTHGVLACAYEVHSALGPGLLESAYKTCFSRELRLRGLEHTSETPVPIQYKGVCLDAGYRADVIVEGRVIVELKAVERVASIHQAQLLTYLRLSGLRIGLLINFNVGSLRHGIHRFIRKAGLPKPSIS